VSRYVLSVLGKGAWSVATRKNLSGAGTGFVASVAGAGVPALAGAGVGDEELPWHGAMATVLPPWWSVTAGGTTFEKSPPDGR
jgi:hypothetical protein